MDICLFVLFFGAVTLSVLPHIQADSLVVISKRYSNNSYSCFVRHTKDGLEYHLTYNVCILDPSTINNGTAVTNNLVGSLHCLLYECTITADELMSADGQLECFRHTYTPPAPVLDRFTTYRKWPGTPFSIPRERRVGRTKRDFSWVTFLEKISFMGRHQSTVSKQNEAYFHYNFMNKPSSGGGGGGGSVGGNRPVQPSPPVADTTTPAIPGPPIEPLTAEA
ncbi:uncharacterized protein LOC120902094 isoform X2 [Anopheles arabiensis]|uniref:uncharacterized protein LOC120957596 n=1 Tax=Anopheles coluzzii TaxID=1518534 RepID=UPI001AACD15B|nr:uncharacterized protein LOC120902094 isoform X2 [Anopheles arabiensis]XP_049466672.1 uncharacterized protein LOC120957596 [Anopheles coluzzii]